MKKIIILIGLFFWVSLGFAQEVLQKMEDVNTSNVSYEVVHPSVIKKPVGFAISGPLNKITLPEGVANPQQSPWFGHEKREASGKPNNIDYQEIYKNDDGMQLKPGWKDNSKGLIHNYDGQTASAYPPDCNGDVGTNYYFQTVNLTYAIYRKSDGALVANGNLNDIFDSSLPGAGYNDGDPIVIYDEQADRWLYAEFSISGANDYMLIAVSTSGDPTGTWYSWSFDVDDTPDYMKFGIEQDGYYMATNTGGAGKNDVYVFDRAAMIAGNASPTMIAFDNPSRPSTFDGFHCIMPLNNSRGNWAPASSHTRFITVADDDQGNPADELRLYDCTPDWATPSNSTFSLSQQIPVNSFTGEFDAADWDNIPQPGTTQQLDAVSTVLMYKAQYRNFTGDNEKIITAHTIAETGTEGAIRWYILTRTGGSGNWSIDQQGTYNPGGTDDDSRWMPGIAMNGQQQVALGFSESSPSKTIYPSIRVVGRSECAPANTMDFAEINIVDGGTYQSTYERWGDYAAMSVDPVDDYTFWFTTEYMNTSNSTKYTKIAAFSFTSSCNPPSVSSVSPTSLYEDRGKQLTITGSDLQGCTFTIGGVSGTVVSNDGSTAVVTFPAGNYTDGTLVVQNAAGTDNSQTITINTRNTIPVVAGSGVTSDNHPTIQSAVDGLYAWYGNTSFDAGDLPGAKTIVVYAGTYSEEVTLNSNLNPSATNGLTIENNSGDAVIVDATGNSFGFNLSTVPYVTLQGFTVHDADSANIYAQGDNVTIQYNQTYNAEESGIKIETGSNNTISNNLSYNNKKYGIEVNSANNTIINNTLDGNGYAYSGSLTKTYTFSGSVDINDNTNAYADIAVPDNVTITKVRVLDMNITHTYDADLDIYLRHPDGTEVELSTDNGGSGNNYTNTNFDDAASTSITSGTAPFTGTYKPEGNLSDFNGKTSNGTWRLRVFDDASGDQGTITSWTLEITYNVNIEQGAGLYVGNVAATVKNNIIVAKSGNDNFYALQSPGNSVTSNYNVYYTTNTNAFDYNGTQDNTGPMSANDLLQDPVFVGSGDYHIQSQAGSYHSGEWPPTTATAGTWTNDASNSPALDGGDPADPYANEPQSGNRINIGAYGNTVQASKSNSIIISWNGSVSSDWQTTGNWDGGAIPTSAEDVLIPNGCPNYPVIDDGISTVAECNNITIENSASLTIAPNGYMTIGGSITNNAGTAGITIQSDATGTGSLIQNSTTGVDATVQRFFASSGRSWHFLTAPISNADIATVFPNTSYLYYYDESTDDYWTGNNYDAGSTMGWTNITSGTMDPKKGYLWNYFQNTLNFAGSLNTSTAGQNITINYTDHGSNAPNGTTYDNYDGWNFVANPFTSAIDWTVVDAHAANLYDAIYVWDGANATYKSWVNGTDSWDGASTNGGTQYIPAMQGFFVKVNENLGTSGTLNIPANARVHNTQTFWKKGTPDNFMRLSVKANGFTDETVVRLLVGATSEMDDHMDAFKLFSYVQAAPQIYTVDDDNTEYSINSLPETKDIRVIPLKIYTNADKFVLSIPEFNFKDYNVFLIDNNEISSNEMELAEGQSYKFSTDGNEQNGRFELIISPKENTTSLAAVSNSVTIYPNPTTGDFYVRMPHNEDYYKVIITTESGKVVYSNEMSGDDYYRISLAGYPAGMYMIKVIKDSGVVHFEKIILK